jgi:hypothetical protein
MTSDISAQGRPPPQADVESVALETQSENRGIQLGKVFRPAFEEIQDLTKFVKDISYHQKPILRGEGGDDSRWRFSLEYGIGENLGGTNAGVGIVLLDRANKRSLRIQAYTEDSQELFLGKPRGGVSLKLSL